MRVIKYETETGPKLGIQQAEAGRGFDAGGRVYDLTSILQNHFERQGGGMPAIPAVCDVEQLADLGLLDVSALGRIFSGAATEDHLVSARPLRLRSPIARPKKIIALGMNYRTHAKELGREAPAEPIIFAKAPTSVVGHEEPVKYYAELDRTDPEVELGVVISRRARNVKAADALSFVGGYTVVNDVTARSMQERDMAARRPWFRSKSLDTFCPLGPAIVLPDEIPNPNELNLQLRVNGELRQNSNTRELIFNVENLLEYITQYITLEPGDLIATGTPEGIAPVRPGDMMEAWIEGIGTLRNPVVG